MTTKLKRFLNWWIEPLDAIPESPKPTGPDLTENESRSMRDLLRGQPHRAQALRMIDNHIPGIPLEARAELIEEALARFAAYVYDLPSSKNDHHARPFGLLDHSLEVTSEVLKAFEAKHVQISQDPVVNTREEPLWQYTAFVMALFHDIGRLDDLRVFAAPDPDPNAVPWDPHAEPLYRYLTRRGLSGTEGGHVRWYSGRDFSVHRWRMALYHHVVLGQGALSRMGRRLAFCIEAYIQGETSYIAPHVPKVAIDIANLVSACDGESSRADKAPKQKDTLPPETPRQKPEVTNGESAQSRSNTRKATRHSSGADNSPRDDSSAQQTTDEATTDRDTSSKSNDTPEPSKDQEPSDPVPAQEEGAQKLPNPKKILEKLQCAIHFSQLKKNLAFGHVWIRPDYIWLDLNNASDRLSDVFDLEWTQTLRAHLVSVLRSEGVLVPFRNGREEAAIIPGPGLASRLALRIRPNRLLTVAQLKTAKHWKNDIVIDDPDLIEVPAPPEEPDDRL